MGTTRRRKRTSRGLLAAGIVGMGVLVAACGPSAEPPPPSGCPTSPPDAIASTIVNRVNADRAATGRGGLAWSGRLACLAQEWSGTMAANGGLAHRNLSTVLGSPGFETYAGLAENVYVGPGTADGNGIHGAWMSSPPHYANIMGNYDAIGVGWVKGADGRLWATQNFGRQR